MSGTNFGTALGLALLLLLGCGHAGLERAAPGDGSWTVEHSEALERALEGFSSEDLVRS